MGVKPILFNTEMVKAILDGRKTCTRRKIPIDIVDFCDIDHDGELLSYENSYGDFINPEKLCKYQPGDILYVRETFVQAASHTFWYKADDKEFLSKCKNWKPSMHMPKEAARIWLKVTDIRVERLHAISEDEARSEGSKKCYELLNPLEDKPIIYSAEDSGGYYVLGFKSIWNSIVKKTDFNIYGWDANPYVWVIEFERCKKPESEETK